MEVRRKTRCVCMAATAQPLEATAQTQQYATEDADIRTHFPFPTIDSFRMEIASNTTSHRSAATCSALKRPLGWLPGIFCPTRENALSFTVRSWGLMLLRGTKSNDGYYIGTRGLSFSIDTEKNRAIQNLCSGRHGFLFLHLATLPRG